MITRNMKLNHVKNYQIEAGKKTIQMIYECIEKRINFSMETTLSGKISVEQIMKAKQNGFKIKMFFLYLKDSSYNLRRIKYRVENGGHDIPRNDVIRRKDRSIRHLLQLIDDLDETFLIDNTGGVPITVAVIKKGKLISKDPALLPSWISEHFK